MIKSNEWVKKLLTKQQQEIKLRLEGLEKQQMDIMEGMHDAKHTEDFPIVADNFSIGILMKENAKRFLQETSLTLKKLEQGTYGICERCRDQIDPARLEIKPTALYCQFCL